MYIPKETVSADPAQSLLLSAKEIVCVNQTMGTDSMLNPRNKKGAHR
jgi:hypothetical protein